VDLFGIISGYLISTITVKKIDQLKAEKFKLILFIKAYFVRRFFRIYPVAIVVFIFVLICSVVSTNTKYFSTPANTLEAGMHLLTYTFNYYFMEAYHSVALAPCWFLTFEVQFYILFPFFIFFTKNSRQRIIILLGLLFFSTFIARPLTMYYFPVSGLFFTQTRCDSVIYGCLIYYLTTQPWFEAMKISSTGNAMLRSSVMIFLIMVLTSIMSMSFSISTAFAIGNILACIIVIPVIFNRNVLVFPLFLQQGLTAVGIRVYSWYLIHYPIFLLTKECWDYFNYSSEIFLRAYSIFVLLLAVLATEILYRLVEKPSIEKGRVVSAQIVSDTPVGYVDILIDQDLLSKKSKDFA